MIAGNPRLRFCFLSGFSADQQEKARTLFGQIKGRKEGGFSSLSPEAVHFQPAFIRPSRSMHKRPLVPRLFVSIADIVDRFTNGLSIAVGQLARRLIAVAKHGAGPSVLDIQAIRNGA